MPCYWIQIQGTCWHLTSCVPRNTYICLDNLLMWWFSLTVRRVSVVLRRTVVGCGDWCFDDLNGSHQQRKSTIAEVINSGSQQQRKSTTALLKTTITRTIRLHYTLNVWSRGKQLLLFSRDEVLYCIFKLSLKQPNGKNMLLYSARRQQLRNCISVGIHLNLIKGTWPRINQSRCSFCLVKD